MPGFRLWHAPVTWGIVKAMWRPFPWFLHRAAGLPLQWLERMDSGATWDIPDEEQWAARVERARAALRSLVCEGLFREALFLSNPSFEAKLTGVLRALKGERRARSRADERTVLRYAQRLCAKNDSTSFFGAVAAGRFDCTADDRPWPVLFSRSVFVTQWVAAAICEAAAEDLRAEGAFVERPTRAPGVMLRDGAYCLELRSDAGFEVVAGMAGSVVEAAVRHATGTATTAELAAAVAEATGVDQASAFDVIDTLLRKGILASTTQLPSGLVDPLRAVIKRLEMQPESTARSRWIARVSRLERLRAEFEGAGCSERRASFAELRIGRSERGFRFTVPTYAGEFADIVPLTRVTGIHLAAPVFPVKPVDLASFLGHDWCWPSRLPRIMWGDIVVHRRCWFLPSCKWADAPTPREAVRRLRRRLGEGVPRFTFVASSTEPKAILVDWSNPLSVEMAIWQARREDHCMFVEMLPGPDHLWFRGSDGYHTAEMRAVFVRR